MLHITSRSYTNSRTDTKKVVLMALLGHARREVMENGPFGPKERRFCREALILIRALEKCFARRFDGRRLS